MRIIVFLVTLFLGISLGSIFKPLSAESKSPCNDSASAQNDVSGAPRYAKFIPEWWPKINMSRNYSHDEARNLIGRKVRNITPTSAKCPKYTGDCLELSAGERGEVVNILPSAGENYLIEIEWETPVSDKFVTYAGKEVSFEIIK